MFNLSRFENVAGRLLVDLKSVRSSAPPIKFLRLSETCGAQPIPHPGIGSQNEKLLGDRMNILWLDDRGGIANHLAQRTARRGDHRATGRHRLNRRHPESFVKRWVNKSVCRPI